MKTAVPKRYERSRPDRTSDALTTLGAGTIIGVGNAMPIGVVQSFVRILGSPRNAVTADISDPGYLPWFSGYSGSRRLLPPATGCQYPAMVRVPSPGLEYERFRSACGRLRHLDGPIARVGTRATQGWTIRGRVRRLSRRFPRTGPTGLVDPT